SGKPFSVCHEVVKNSAASPAAGGTCPAAENAHINPAAMRTKLARTKALTLLGNTAPTLGRLGLQVEDLSQQRSDAGRMVFSKLLWVRQPLEPRRIGPLPGAPVGKP